MKMIYFILILQLSGLAVTALGQANDTTTSSTLGNLSNNSSKTVLSTKTTGHAAVPTQQPASATTASSTKSAATATTASSHGQAISTVDQQIGDLKEVVNTLGRQIIDLQTFVEERIRSEGQSGVKVARHVHEGTREYYSDTHISATALSAHDHADYLKVLGLGEFIAVLNGVEFRTRHNDYLLMKPVQGRTFNGADDIPYPDVPPEVTGKVTMEEKVTELREWYKAFKNQDHSVRDYRKYFKANLCYLEGGWTLSSRDKLEEPFKSSRHAIDATSWFDLSEKIRYTSSAGLQDQLENYAYLPTTMYNVSEDGTPQIAQWNYRIMCHPLKDDLPTSLFQMQDDLTVRMTRKLPMEKIRDLRAARFKINEFGVDRKTRDTLLDKLMYQIPGKDNYEANLTDDAFGLMNFDVSKADQQPINVGFYHRWFKVGRRGAMGNAINHRGFNDENMWVARTTQPNIMPLSIQVCDGTGLCHWEIRRTTYAVPLEVVYTSPLNSWNPYNLSHSTPKHAEAKGRDGRLSPMQAFNGTSYRHYYRTPIEFYQTCTSSKSPRADAVGMLDPQGQMRTVAASGISIVTPEIEGVGKVRLRYPIFPVHSEGSTVGKELQALKDMVMKMDRYRHLYEEPPCSGKDDLI